MRSLRQLTLRGDGVFAQLARFALVGVASNVVYFIVFVQLSSHGPLIANVVGAQLSTALANELHRRLTFGAAKRVGWFTAQWAGGGFAVAGLALSSAAISLLTAIFPSATGVTAAASVLAVTACIGGLRFIALRACVFRPREHSHDIVDSIRDRQASVPVGVLGNIASTARRHRKATHGSKLLT